MTSRLTHTLRALLGVLKIPKKFFSVLSLSEVASGFKYF